MRCHNSIRSNGVVGRESSEEPTRRDLAAEAGASGDVPLPDAIAGYDIEKVIHRGGQGIVYRAVQKSTRRKVAIKVMREGPFAGEADKARFDLEIVVLGQLNHPNIVTIHDSGQSAGIYFLVMDLIRGEPLDAYVTEEKLSLQATLRLFAKVCAAVNAAHLKGITHRDLKPGNILVDADGEPRMMRSLLSLPKAPPESFLAFSTFLTFWTP